MHIYRPRPILLPSFQLICFPCAGGSAVFFSKWLGFLPAGIELMSLEYPGHGSRLLESPCQTLEEVVAHAERDTLPFLNVPFAFFGHSMGALVAFELTRRLRDAGSPTPHHLFLSARSAPHLPPLNPPRGSLSDTELLRVMVELGGTAQAVVENQELINLLLPVIRADLRALETSTHNAGPPLQIPFSLFGGLDDAEAPWSRVQAWEELTTGPVTKHLFPGGHFFIQEYCPAVTDIIVKHMTGAARNRSAVREGNERSPAKA